MVTYSWREVIGWNDRNFIPHLLPRVVTKNQGTILNVSKILALKIFYGPQKLDILREIK
jgi:hypothetical protein